MAPLRFIASCALLLTAVFGSPFPLEVIDIEEGFIPITLVRQGGDPVFALNNSVVGYGRLTDVGISVNRGASARLRFNVEVNAISAERLENSDSTFESSLNEEERQSYRSRKSSYSGGLGVSFLGVLGANINKRVTKESMEFARSLDVNYDQKSTLARKILEDVVESRVRITGELLATGVDLIPTVATARVRTARITLADNSRLSVVSSTADDLVALDSNNDPLPVSDKEYEVFDL
ncbi:unnamed protein product [Chondrus crispus]|uniref:Lipid-binding serum glycoprotein N-terminal domain-containing protein n=1 Tax=Chondrus crispus TaxID=2769 RepID=R7QBR7_CHOCR|nr:unnamed protein product [Chondrus crispus]CDF35479.1 unnamed protein product [Chondrus crispus]|eukprot:XP_005715298.1 unnamed protein product [Chondrus crispus]